MNKEKCICKMYELLATLEKRNKLQEMIRLTGAGGCDSTMGMSPLERSIQRIAEDFEEEISDSFRAKEQSE